MSDTNDIVAKIPDALLLDEVTLCIPAQAIVIFP